MAISADILRGYTDTIILRQLAQEDSYGYRLSKRVFLISEGKLELKEATLYTAFKRLETGGYIQSYWGDEQTGARRRYYSITEAGKQRLAADCEAWEETKRLITELLKGADGHE